MTDLYIVSTEIDGQKVIKTGPCPLQEARVYVLGCFPNSATFLVIERVPAAAIDTKEPIDWFALNKS